ncbi:DUF5050 domain-containing protein [Alkaliphilus pronyensis]|uniref:DUF5050 domain-containing protein n=1 Tax=Alkaliphilus pronyensis TaxID=1482732 RepID=A0A6I0FAD9_9FIRM|nr:DUF5050 domain-containing protein [Alkaliphilus pronyensis]KAB3534133.1 DUF5050 domain-containing protein [Alkaliphilus pronyensis]
MRKSIIIFLIFLSLISLTGCNLSKINIQDDNSSNIANGMTFFEYNNHIYHSGMNGIFKFNMNMKNSKRIIEGNFSTINIDNDWIYTGLYSKDRQGIYRVKIDGSTLEELTNLPGTFINKKDNYLYFSYNGINKLNIENKKIEKLAEDNSRYMYIFENSLYYINLSDNSKLYKINLATDEKKVIIEDEITFMVMEGDSIYYLSDGYIKKIKANGNENTVIRENEGVVSWLNVKDGIIYFSERDLKDNAWKVYKIDPNKQETMLIHEGIAKNLNIVDKYIFYYSEGNYHRMKLDGSDNETVKVQ